MIYPILDENGNVVVPTIILCHRNKTKIGNIYPVEDFEITPDLDNTNECSFKVYKEINGRQIKYWDQILDLKVIYIPEWNEYFQISLDKNETNSIVKSITASNLGKAELSQIILRDIEINTENDIARDDYTLAYIYDELDVENSVLGRVLSKSPHFTIKHVDDSLCKLVRSFSINNKSIDDFLCNDLAKELNCIVIIGSDRSVSLYDLENSCPNCGYREEGLTECPKCYSQMNHGYGEETNIYISTDNLSKSIDIQTKDDEVKNTFYVSGGDDVITAAIRAINPNGSSYINRFSNIQREDMSDDLYYNLIDYENTYDNYQNTYKTTMEKLYEYIDKILYLTSEMMPSIETDDTDANKELAKLTPENLGEIAVQSYSSTSLTVATNSVESMAKIFISAGYKLDVKGTSYLNNIWKGKFTVTSVDDETDTATNETDISIKITENYETFIQQKLKKILAKESLSDEEIYDWTEYCLNRLSSFSDAYQNCIDVLTQMGVSKSSHEFYKSIYLPYYNKKIEIDDEIKNREADISIAEGNRDVYQRNAEEIQNKLNLEKFLGTKLYNEYLSYRREDSYQNDNYVSDGLSNTEILTKAQELFEVAKKELYKSSELQVDASTSIGNIWTINEFKSIIPQWKNGNWVRIQSDDELYKVRLINYTIKSKDFSEISCNFSSTVKISSGISDIQSVLNNSKSMATSYDSVKRQAKHSEETGKKVTGWIDKGLSTTAVAIKDSDNQNIVYDRHGLLCRSWNDITQSYENEQFKVTNNVLALTDDNWKTVRAAIGKIYYQDPENPNNILSSYGVIGETIIGKLLLGETLGIYNESNSLKFNKDGLLITNNINSFSINPNNTTLLSLSNSDGEILYVDDTGKLHVKGDGVFSGTIYASSGYIGKDQSIGWTIEDSAIYNGTSGMSTSIDDGSFTDGMYICTTGIRSCKSSQYVDVESGNIRFGYKGKIPSLIYAKPSDEDGNMTLMMYSENYIQIYSKEKLKLYSANDVQIFAKNEASMQGKTVYLMNGNASKKTGVNETWGCIVTGGLIVDGSTVTSSDRDKKYDINDLNVDKILQFVYSLRPREFRYINGDSGRLHHGFIAQELYEQMYDDWGVYIDDAEQGKGIRYEELISDLVTVVQQQKREITDLQDRILKLEKRGEI